MAEEEQENIQNTKSAQNVEEDKNVLEQITDFFGGPAPEEMPGSVLQGTKSTEDLSAAPQGQDDGETILEQITDFFGGPAPENMPGSILQGTKPIEDIISAPELSPEEIAAEKIQPASEVLAQEELERRRKEEELKRQQAEAAVKAAEQQRVAAAAKAKAIDADKRAQKEAEQSIDTAVTEETREGGMLHQASPMQKKFRHVIALLLGGISQGLTGAKTNPVLDYLDKEFEKEMDQRKFNEQKKQQLRVAAIQQMQLQMRRYEIGQKDRELQHKLDVENKKLEAVKQAELEKIKLNKRISQGTFKREELFHLPDNLNKQAVRVPGTDEFTIIPDAQTAKKIGEENSGLENAKQDLAQIVKLIDYFGNYTHKKFLSREEIRQAETLQQAVIGNLRIILFGPGVITDNERAIAENIVPDASKVFTLESANRIAATTLLDKVNFAMRDRIRAAGGYVPPDANEQNILNLKNRIMKNNPGMHPREAESMAIDTLHTTNNWVR